MVRRGFDRRWLAVLALLGLVVIGGYGWCCRAEPERVVLALDAVSYTHLTLPTKVNV